MSERTTTSGGSVACSAVPGQVVLPGMAEALGYEAIVLSPKHERFCWEYVHRADNGTRAYLAVYPGVKETTARANASALLANTDIKARVEQIRAELRERLASVVVNYHRQVMELDHLALLDEIEGDLKPVAQLTDEQRAVLEVEQIVANKRVVTVIRVPSKRQSADSLAKILGMNKDVPAAPSSITVTHQGVMGMAEDVSRFDVLRRKMGMDRSGEDERPADTAP